MDAESAQPGNGVREVAGQADGAGSSADGAVRSGLLIDWGGVLTSSLVASFSAYCREVRIDPQTLLGRFRSDPGARELLIALEKGELEEAAFELQLAAQLGVEPEGLIDGLFAGVEPDAAMVDAVRSARQAGMRTALVSNSWGVHRYPRDLFSELFDGVVISGEERMRKPSRRMYELGAERAGAAGRALRLRRRPGLQSRSRREARHGDRPSHERRGDDPPARAAARIALSARCAQRRSRLSRACRGRTGT